MVCKPARMDFHNSGDEIGFLNILRRELNEPDLLPVNRLDKQTSGLLVVARNPETAAKLNRLFAERNVEKYYVAFSARKPRKKQGWVRGGMERSRRGTWKLTRTKENFAVTRFLSRSFRPGIRAFLLRLYTGRTHQARVALKSVGAAVLGDPVYERGVETKTDRMYLHAFGLHFTIDGKEEFFVSIPNDGVLFQQAAKTGFFELWSEPWGKW